MNLDLALQYLKAIEAGATGEALAAFFAPDVIQREFPNRLVPNGVARDLKALLEGSERGQRVVTAQRYLVRQSVSEGDSVALEVDWSATLLVPVGTLPAGSVMKAAFGMFLRYRDGKIVAQHNYDCFEPF